MSQWLNTAEKAESETNVATRKKDDLTLTFREEEQRR